MSEKICISSLTQEQLANYFPLFINKTNLPINLETWQSDESQVFGKLTQSGKLIIEDHGLISTKSITINPNQQFVMYSIGEVWDLNSFLNPDIADLWKSQGIEPGYHLGKFWIKSCFNNINSFIDKPFEILYDKEKNIFTLINNLI